MKGVPLKFRIVDVDGNCKFVELQEIVTLGYDVEISQLVCYDINGNEVYEGDTLVYDDDFDYDEGKVGLVPTWTHGYIELDKETIEDYNLRIKE